jgi:alkanesulfonate monooxygenase SsuD/methylene tetrahydromethanopterin reductase-like flavin-dependent oxidoreductase (luciferase family)
MRRFAAQMPWGQPSIWLASVLEPMARLAGEVADGVIFHHNPLRTLPETIEAVYEEAERAGRPRPKIAAYARTAHDRDPATARALAREITFEFLHFPVYQRLYRRAGFEAEVAQALAAMETGDRAAGLEAASDELLDDYLFVGDVDYVRRQEERFAAAGVDVLLYAPLPLRGKPLRQKFDSLLRDFRYDRIPA